MDSPRIIIRAIRRMAALAAIAVLGAAVLACSGDDGDGTAASAPAPQTTTAAGATAATAAAGDAVTIAIGTDAGGEHLVGPSGHALYFFASDEPGVSHCTGGCAGNWPPLTIAADASPSAADGVDGTLGAIEREDGLRQVTLDGRPLYFFIGDTAAGQTTGDGVGGVWSLARPGAASGASTTTTSGGGGGQYDYGE